MRGSTIAAAAVVLLAAGIFSQGASADAPRGMSDPALEARVAALEARVARLEASQAHGSRRQTVTIRVDEQCGFTSASCRFNARQICENLGYENSVVSRSEQIERRYWLKRVTCAP
ncbi:hypothetical protein [Stakelama tenebrarum]|uniref:UrcA family protein n=1 Tax=Stakelama tenebrarum TaxID=2711215 RepID=A0A6G6Y5W9_9SPHN|nr:hypothetical protein [Sphingosinithalassobacter tenebrarum]QIG80315.1 hypothetical protein G5C33_11360 [Sphingosinithalassobacter tenebrarum]